MTIAKSLLLFPFLIASASAQVGIASHYPGDRGINYDPEVLFFDDFESYTSPSQLTTKWTKAYKTENLRIATEAADVYSGAKALEFKLPISGMEVANACKKAISPKQNTLFIRAYMKFDPGFHVVGSSHTGLTLSANYPGPGNGTPRDGTGWFLFLLQNNLQGPLSGGIPPGNAHLYVYWPKQRGAFGDHWYPDGRVVPWETGIGNKGDWVAYPMQYPHFQPYPNNVMPPRDKWFCYELMVHANTPGQKDGEVKCWYNGRLVADFPDLSIRSIPTLEIDQASIGLHAQHSERINKKWYDNVVIAKKYIGPMTPLRP